MPEILNHILIILMLLTKNNSIMKQMIHITRKGGSIRMPTYDYELCETCEAAMEEAGVLGVTVEEMIKQQVQFDFGTAISFLKEGYKVARKGWNGKGMWIALMPALYLEAGVVNGRTSKHLGQGVSLDSQPYIAMFTAMKQWQPGWLASQADMLAEDWVIVPSNSNKTQVE